MTKWDLFQDAILVQHLKSTDAIHHVNKLRGESHMILSIDTQEIHFTKSISHLWFKNFFLAIENWEELSEFDKKYLQEKKKKTQL